MKPISMFFVILFATFLVACSTSTVSSDDSDEWKKQEKSSSSSGVVTKSIFDAVEELGLYTTKDSVAAYLCKFDKLPSNYVSKTDGKKLYESRTGNAFEKWNFNPWITIGVMIGGDSFNNYSSTTNNYREALPEGEYFEADIDYSAENRGTKRLVYQSDCIIYYTADHYNTFNKLKIR